MCRLDCPQRVGRNRIAQLLNPKNGRLFSVPLIAARRTHNRYAVMKGNRYSVRKFGSA